MMFMTNQWSAFTDVVNDGICLGSLKRTDIRYMVLNVCRLEANRDEDLGDSAWVEGRRERRKYYGRVGVRDGR